MEEWQQSTMNISHSNVTTVLSVQQQEKIMIIQITMATLSVLGAGSTFTAMVWRDQVTKPEMLPFFQLSMVDVLAAMGIILSCSLYISDVNDTINVCNITTTFATAFYMVSFALTITFALESLRQLKGNDQMDRLMSIAYAVSWAVILPYFAVAFLTDQWNTLSNGEECTKHNYQCLVIMHHIDDKCMGKDRAENRGRDTIKAYFLAVLISTFLSLTVLYLLIYKRVKEKNSEGGMVRQEQHTKAQYTRNRGILHCASFVVCWLPTLIIGFVTYSHSVSVTSRPVYSLYIMQAILSPSQGFMNSIIYGWSRATFHRALRLHVNVSPSRVPFANWRVRTTSIYHTFSDHEAESSDADFNANRAPLM
ncbi:transmembrane protein 116-like [Apostichopus japonicus]|uniref:transmembrane protein 116-like n=1 Tax=Stichopus japonicus TaxID=307972 RepID=UPI003AB138F4